MKRLTIIWLLLLPALVQAQITIGDAVLPSEVEQARTTLERAAAKTLNLAVGEFEVIEPAKGITSPLLWITSSVNCVQRIEVQANQPLGLWLKRRGEPATKLHQFPGKPFSWVILIGTKPGTSTIHIIRNGTSGTAPVVIDKLDVTVGGSVPPPPTPVEDDLTQALRAAWQRDQANSKADRKWVLALAGIYEAAGLDTLETVKTAGELDQLLNTARQAAGIPEPDQALPTLRHRIRQELLTRLNIPENGASQPLALETKKQARLLLTQIAQALEAIQP